MEEVVDHKAQCDGHQHHLDDGEKHVHGVHIHALTGVQQGEQRGEHRSQHGGNGGHADGQGNIALGQVGHHVGRGAAGAGAHQNDADGLCHAAYDDVLRAAEHHLEVIGLQRQAHAEHHDAQQGVHPAGFDHTERAGEEQGTGCHHDDDGGHVLAHKIAYFFQSFHVVSSFLFYRLFLHETSGMARCRNKKRLCLPS